MQTLHEKKIKQNACYTEQNMLLNKQNKFIVQLFICSTFNAYMDGFL